MATWKRLGILGEHIFGFSKHLTLPVESLRLFNIPNHFFFLFDKAIQYPLMRSFARPIHNAITYKPHYLLYLPDFCLFRTLKLKTKTYFA